MGAYGIMKGLEWGLAQDLLPYTWVGFAGTTTDNGKDPSAKTPADRREAKKRRRAYLASLRAKQAQSDGPLAVLRATLHLLISMRGQGYDFCGTTTEPFALSQGAFLRRLVGEIAWAHPLLTACAAVLLEPPTSRDALLYAAWPALPVRHAHYLGEAMTGLAMGVAVFAALTLGYSLATLGACLGTLFLRHVVPFSPLPSAVLPPPFDPREYPPLFNLRRRPQSVALFWSHQWHSFFARPFRFLAFGPVQRVVGRVAGKLAGRTCGVLAVFALSAWLHEFGASCSLLPALPPFSLRCLSPNTPFVLNLTHLNSSQASPRQSRPSHHPAPPPSPS